VTLRGRAFPLVIAAPSGAGKTSIARALVERNPDVEFSVSATTRPKREDEAPDVHYHFVSDAEFDRMVGASELIEWAYVHDRRYGTPRAAVERALAQGKTVVLDIDVQGARQIRATFPDAVLAFILPPSADELGRRLAGRASEKTAEQERRLENARREIRDAGEFDYIVVNENLDDAVRALETILRAEQMRVARMPDLKSALGDIDAGLGTILERST
jgi:guanylate kinase